MVDLCNRLAVFEFSHDRDRLVRLLANDGTFTISSTRRFIDGSILVSLALATRWCTLVPKKLSVLMWRIVRNRIPTRLNLQDKGKDLHSVLYPVCEFVK